MTTHSLRSSSVQGSSVPPGEGARASYTEIETDEVSTIPGVRMFRIRLQGEQYGPFNGAICETPIDAQATEVQGHDAGHRLADAMTRLIRQGRIRFNPPDHQMERADYFDEQGNPYMGMAVWKGHQLYIERIKIAT